MVYQIDSIDATATYPTPLAAGSPGWYAQGFPFTTVSPDWLNSIQAELLGILSQTSVTSANGTNSQLVTALSIVYAKLHSPAFTGNPTTPLPAANNNSFTIPCTTWVWNTLLSYVSWGLPAFSRTTSFGPFGTNAGPYYFNWTAPAETFFARVTVCGGGAGGGACNSSTYNFSGAGGGAGGIIASVVGVSPGTTYSGIVGCGGGGGATGGGNGTNGGTSSLLGLTAYGGIGGGGVNGGTSGGQGGNTAYSAWLAPLFYTQGGWGADGNLTNALIAGGHGGASFFGGGGRAGTGAGGGGQSALTYGAGGGGAYYTSGPGGSGEGGIIIVEV